jgi:hypothetical protein
MIRWLLVLSFMLILHLTGPVRGETTSDSKTVGHVVIYLGVLPTEMIRGHPAQHSETSMHGGRPKTSGECHVVVALFNATSGTRIEKAEISARVSEIGLAGEEKKLAPMEIAGTVTYGNYFRMLGNGPFRIALSLRLPGEPQELNAAFEHRHQ